MEHLTPLNAEALLAHRDWIRSLARTLVSDASRADDIAQETWIVAQAKAPREAKNLRAWLTEVVRNIARSSARAESRRSQREHVVARSELVPDTADLVAQASLQRALVGHVLELDETYRSVVLLRFFQELGVREIASRLNVPVNTVRTRLQRALAQLRTKLDSECGERSSWCASFATLAPAARHVGWTSTMGMLAATTWKVAAIVLLAAGALFWYRGRLPDAASPPVQLAQRQSENLDVPARTTPSDRDPSPRSSSERTPIAGSSGSAAAASVAPLAASTFEGRVVDVRGAPVPNLRLRPLYRRPAWLASTLEELAPTAITDSNGAFHLEIPGTVREIEVAGGVWTFVSDGWRERPREHIYIVAPAVDVAGVVVDAAGVPAARVYVERHASWRGLREFPWALEDGLDDYSALAITDDHGRFHLGVIAFVPGERITAGWMEHASVVGIPIPERSQNDLVIVINPQHSDTRPRVRGLVIDDAGRPVVGAQVHFSNDETSSDENGRFELAVGYFDEDVPLTATVRGQIAAVIDGFGYSLRKRQQEQDHASIDDVILRLGGPALSISGRLFDSSGHPCAGWKIDLDDRTPLGNSSMSLEAVTAGHRTDHDFPVTDASGRFTIDGLRDRPYRVRAWDERTCLVLISDPVRAGSSDLEMHAPADAFRARVRGRVVSSSGEPVSGARVALAQVRLRMRATLSFANCREVTADDSGRFEFLEVPRRGMWFAISGPHVEYRRVPIAEDARGDDVEIVVTLVCRIRVALSPGDSADAFELLDANGKGLMVMTQRSESISAYERVPLEAHGFPVCEVSDTARTLVLYHGKTELRRVPVELHAGDLQNITP